MSSMHRAPAGRLHAWRPSGLPLQPPGADSVRTVLQSAPSTSPASTSLRCVLPHAKSTGLHLALHASCGALAGRRAYPGRGRSHHSRPQCRSHSPLRTREHFQRAHRNRLAACVQSWAGAQTFDELLLLKRGGRVRPCHAAHAVCTLPAAPASRSSPWQLAAAPSTPLRLSLAVHSRVQHAVCCSSLPLKTGHSRGQPHLHSIQQLRALMGRLQAGAA